MAGGRLVLLLISPLINAVTVRFVPLCPVYRPSHHGMRHRRCPEEPAGPLDRRRRHYRARLVWPCAKVKNLPTWLQLNNSGAQAMALWPDMARIYEALQGQAGDSRIIYEHISHNDRYGADRAFEALPHWTGRPTLGGLHIQASPNSPFISYLQSEISTFSPAAPPLCHHIRLNLTRAKEHMALYNVGRFIARDQNTVQAALTTPGLRPSGEFGPFRVFDVEGCPGSYAIAPKCRPVAVVTERPQFIAFQWFRFTNLKTPLVFFNPGEDIPAGRFAAVLEDDGAKAARSWRSAKKTACLARPCSATPQ